ncbi:replication initiator protein [Microviridae sp.]|nr:replication initiator protein [Microviridae sp.]
MPCDTPYLIIRAGQMVKGTIYNKDVLVPCGKCPPCKIRRVMEWGFRLEEEDCVSSSSLFITLTYDTKHVPISPNGFMTLNKRDIQLFFKRLRKNHGKQSKEKLRYYIVGEYGETNKRPHYHAILFNLHHPDLIDLSWLLGGTHIGKVNQATIGYTCKYIDKAKRIPEHPNDDRLKEFSLMSKKIGHSYLTPQIIRFHRSDYLNRNYVTRYNGVKLPMPAYYRKRIFTETERRHQVTHIQQRMDDHDKLSEEAFNKKYPDSICYQEYKERLKVNRYNNFYHTQKIRS